LLQEEFKDTILVSLLSTETAVHTSKRSGKVKTSIICKVESRKGNISMVLYRSFIHFRKFHQKLEEELPSVAKENPLPRLKSLLVNPGSSNNSSSSFPTLGNSDISSFNEVAQKELQEYLNSLIMNDDFRNSNLISLFLDPWENPLLISLSDIHLEGFLRQNTGIIGGWVERYAVLLKNKRLILYKENHPFSVPTNMLRLDYSIVELSKQQQLQHCFDVKSLLDDREFFFRARDEQERNEWIIAIRNIKTIKSMPSISSSLNKNVEKQLGLNNEQEAFVLIKKYLDSLNPAELFTPTTGNAGEHSNSLTQAQMIEEDSEKNFLFNVQKQQIKGGTVEKLLEKLTEEQQDMDYVLCFLLTYRSFTTPNNLLNICLQRFRCPPLRQHSTEQFEEKKQIHPTQLRVCTILSKWIDVNFGDFIEDNQLLLSLLTFMESELLNNLKYAIMGKKLKEVIRKRITTPQRASRIFSCDLPAPELPLLLNECSFELIDLTSLEVSRQLTLIDFSLFRNIQPKECLKVKDKEQQAPNLSAVIKRFNQVSNWIVAYITQIEELRPRIQILTKFIEIAQCCMTMNNYNSAMEIISGLNSAAVFRLQKTWSGLSANLLNSFEQMKTQLSNQHNYKLYREMLHTQQPPCCPYFGVYLTDLTFVEEGNPDKLENGLINFEKNFLFYKVIKEIKLYQQTPYNFQVVDRIQDYLLSVETLDENEAYNLSLRDEPREPST